MIKMILLTGFFGSGKTTMMKSILDVYKNEVISVIINEYGKINIDAASIKKEGIDIKEICNGSIFSSDLKDIFINILIEMASQDIQYLFVEVSGLADPASFDCIMNELDFKIKRKYDYKGTICIIDAERFLDIHKAFPEINHQVEYCDDVIINKVDIVEMNRLKDTYDKVLKINPFAEIHMTSHCSVNIKSIIDNLDNWIAKEAIDLTDIQESSLMSFVINSQEVLPFEIFKTFIDEIKSLVYRVKGYMETDRGIIEVSATAKNVSLVDWHRCNQKSELVIISTKGRKITRKIKKTINSYFHGKVEILT